jgi:hypothetical protein
MRTTPLRAGSENPGDDVSESSEVFREANQVRLVRLNLASGGEAEEFVGGCLARILRMVLKTELDRSIKKLLRREGFPLQSQADSSLFRAGFEIIELAGAAGHGFRPVYAFLRGHNKLQEEFPF